MKLSAAKLLVNRFVAAFVSVAAFVCFGLLGIIGVGPRTGRYATLTVLSGSMQPGIRPGAMLIDIPEPGRALRIGQIVTYAIPVDDHHVVTHRVVTIISGGDHPVFQTKGDANDSVDPWRVTATSATVWRVRAVVPGLGLAIHWLRDSAIHLVGVVLLPFVVASWWVLTIWRDDDEPEMGFGPA